MMTRAQLRKGWCPGALRPMQSGDGLLLRIRPRLGMLPVAALAEIAKAARIFGSGEIDLTNRGNLQLRGLNAEAYPAALALLDEAGLVDADPGIEAVRNIVVDPLSGIDPARADVRTIAGQLENVLAENAAFRHLPGKFGFSFSGTAEAVVGGRSTDIMVSATDASFVICLDGTSEAKAVLSASQVIDSVARLVAVFIELRAGDAAIGRMKDAVARCGGAKIFAAAGLQTSMLRQTAHAPASYIPVGLLQHSKLVFAAGIGLPFGRIDAQQLQALYASAADLGLNSVRLSPQRVLVFPVEQHSEASLILDEADRIGLITTADDPRLFFDVCPGAPACANATTETRRDAQRIADTLRDIAPMPSLHISGCEKGCARSAAAALTLVARDGRYDIICNGGPTGAVALTGVEPAAIDAAVARFILKQAS